MMCGLRKVSPSLAQRDPCSTMISHTALSQAEMQLALTDKEDGHSTLAGSVAWLSEGLGLEKVQ